MSSILYYEPLYSLDCAFPDLLESALKPRRRTTDTASHHPIAASTWKPRMDLHQDEGKNLVTVTLELPGLKKEDVALEISNGFLKISAETKPSHNYEESGYIVRERRFGKFSRSIKLTPDIKEEGITATMVDGLLTITLPKKSPEHESKRIHVG